MKQVEERYRGSRGAVTQVVVGRQLKPPLRMEAGVMSWILASYNQVNRRADGSFGHLHTFINTCTYTSTYLEGVTYR